jgi:hypothetical protein
VITPLGEYGARRVEQGSPRALPPLRLRASLSVLIYIHSVCILLPRAGDVKVWVDGRWRDAPGAVCRAHMAGPTTTNKIQGPEPMNVRAPALIVLKPGRTRRWCAPTERTLGEASPSADSPPWKRDLVVARRGLAACFPQNDRAPASLGPGSPVCSTAALGARRPAHHAAAPERAVLVEDLLGGQQRPKALQSLLDTHIYLRLKKGYKLRPGYVHFANSDIVDLSALCERVLHSGSGRTVRYTRDDLRTMLRRVVPSSLITSSVPNKAHRRCSRFQVFILHTSFSYPLTFILYVCYYRVCEMSRLLFPYSAWELYESAWTSQLWRLNEAA